jgi:hypothetical protein
LRGRRRRGRKAKGRLSRWTAAWRGRVVLPETGVHGSGPPSLDGRPWQYGFCRWHQLPAQAASRAALLTLYMVTMAFQRHHFMCPSSNHRQEGRGYMQVHRQGGHEAVGGAGIAALMLKHRMSGKQTSAVGSPIFLEWGLREHLRTGRQGNGAW